MHQKQNNAFNTKYSSKSTNYKTNFAKTDNNFFNIHRKVNDQKIINKFYMPFIVKREYNINLNENLGAIKRNTQNSAKINHSLNQKKKEILKKGSEFLIFNNPSKILLKKISMLIKFLTRLIIILSRVQFIKD